MKTITRHQSDPAIDKQGRRYRGVALLLTLVMMVILTTLVYTLTMRTTAQRYRSQYFIDYAKARYACDSGLKFMLTTMKTTAFEPNCIARPNEPDFSDLFSRSDDEIQELIDYYSQLNGTLTQDTHQGDTSMSTDDVNGAGFGIEDMPADTSIADRIRGPYGPPWPFAMEPVKIDIDDTTHAEIDVIDENAKYPIAWLLLNDPNVDPAIKVSFETFGEWMGLSRSEIGDVRDQLQEIAAIKPFQREFKVVANQQSRTRGTNPTPKVSAAIQEKRQNLDFANLLNSSLFKTDVLARPIYESQQRSESALKYIGRWGHVLVNVNTAPQQVLEAALVFGGDSVPVAAEIIRQRQEQPFASLDDLEKRVVKYADQIKKCEKFITCKSTRFTIRVTAYSGVAQSTALASIELSGAQNKAPKNKNAYKGDNIKVLAIVSE